MHLPWGRSLRDPLTILGRESVEGAGLGMEKEVPVVAGRSAEGERPGLSLESWAGWCCASWQQAYRCRRHGQAVGVGHTFFIT